VTKNLHVPWTYETLVLSVRLSQNSDFLEGNCLLLEFTWLSGITSGERVSKFPSSWHQVLSVIPRAAYIELSYTTLPALIYPFSAGDKSFQQWGTNHCRVTIAPRIHHIQNVASLSDVVAMLRINSLCLREKELEQLLSSSVPKET